MSRERRDYGAAVRVWRTTTRTGYYIMPPRSQDTIQRYRDSMGFWSTLWCSTGAGLQREVPQKAGPHLGRRITWGELPAAVQEFARRSFLGQYCPEVSKDGNPNT